MKITVFSILGSLCMTVFAYAQEDTTKEKTLEEIILSANKWEQKMNEVPNKIIKVNKLQVLRNNPQTAADLLGQTGAVFIQKSQLGGGSPMIRGFATNRVLLVMDGVRMNNAIYRSGNLHNVISIDALATETAEVIFGPGSLTYGSDAIGGVMDFHSLEARLSKDSNWQLKGSVLTRYAAANKENTIHADINLSGEKWSLLSSVTYSKFDDLKMGKHGGPGSYLRPEYVIRQNNSDVIIQNTNPRIQRLSGYDQWNVVQKIRFKPSDHLDIQYSFIAAVTGHAPRYDRLIQYRNGSLRFAEWFYGPMRWSMHNLRVSHSKKNNLYDDLKMTIAYQDYEESRIDRPRNNNNRTRQVESVDAVSINLDATKQMGRGDFFYGLEYVHNKVGSAGERTDIISGSKTIYASRYPDGSKWNTAGIYSSYKINLHPKLTFTTGLRYSYNSLRASFDKTFINFPYDNAKLKDGAVTGNAGLAYRATETWQLNANISSGYRMPNVDDIGKLFENAPGNITVPNPGLKSEYAWNAEVGIIKHIPNKFRLELNSFYTILDNAIVRRPFQFNEKDSIFFDGTLSRVEALQNVANATVWGLQTSAELFFTPVLSVQTHANWITGKETDDVNEIQVPLRHAPPFYGSTFLRYRYRKLFSEIAVLYNSRVSNKELAASEQAKTDIYAKDANGLPYSPGWYTINLKASYQVSCNLLLTAGWENLTNQCYRPYSSGIVAAGSNFIVSLRVSMD